MCGSMVDIQSLTAEIRRGKKEEGKKTEITRQKNIMVCPITQGDHNNLVHVSNGYQVPVNQFGDHQPCYLHQKYFS